MAAAATNALRSAEMSPVEVGYVNAHGTGTADNDPAETAALKTVFGAGSVPLLSSTKGTTGHALGASGESRRWPPLLGVLRLGRTHLDPSFTSDPPHHPPEGATHGVRAVVAATCMSSTTSTFPE